MTRKAVTLIRTRDVLALRLNGRPRDPGNGQHKQVVIVTETTITPTRLAVLLRDAADRLELLEQSSG